MVGQHLYMGDLCYCGFVGELFFLYTLGDDLNHYCNFLFQMNCDRKKKGTCAHSLKEKRKSTVLCIQLLCRAIGLYGYRIQAYVSGSAPMWGHNSMACCSVLSMGVKKKKSDLL